MSDDKGSDTVSTVIGLAIVLVIGGGLFFAFGTFSGDTLGRIPMKAEAQTITIEVDEAGTLQIWADVEITHREFSPNIAAVELPHVLDYVVDVHSSGQAFETQFCNPFDSNFMRRSDKSNSVGQDAGRWYDGLIRGCGFKVGPGTYEVTARTVPVDPDPRVSLRKNDMVLRLE